MSGGGFDRCFHYGLDFEFDICLILIFCCFFDVGVYGEFAFGCELDFGVGVYYEVCF